MDNYDIVILGAGIVGLTLARELASQKAGRILILEKERQLGVHASGRNSGVIHAGLYYAPDSQRARFCRDGSTRLHAYAEEHNIPLLRCGKVIVATREENVATLETILERAKQNRVEVQKISLAELRELEPQAKSNSHALWSPKTSVVDSKAVLQSLLRELRDLHVEVSFDERARNFAPNTHQLTTAKRQIHYGYLINAAGVYADEIAKSFGLAKDYRILPFKGLYWKAAPEFAAQIQRLIYPAPDVRMPFLGVHITRTTDGHVLFGPTAMPALGRENYSGLQNFSWSDTPAIATNLARMWLANKNSFRNYVNQEIRRYSSRAFYQEARQLVQNLNRSDIAGFYKVGIRAQLVNTAKGLLEMDFVVQRTSNSVHILNAISPAFTCSFAMAEQLTPLVLGEKPSCPKASPQAIN